MTPGYFVTGGTTQINGWHPTAQIMKDLITGEELFSFKVLSPIPFKDGSGNIQGEYRTGQICNFSAEVGSHYIEQGLAVQIDPVTGEELEPAPGESAVVTDETDELKNEPDMPSQTEENEILNTPTNNVAKFRITAPDVKVFGDIMEEGSVVELADDIGELLVKDGSAERVEE